MQAGATARFTAGNGRLKQLLRRLCKLHMDACSPTGTLYLTITGKEGLVEPIRCPDNTVCLHCCRMHPSQPLLLLLLPRLCLLLLDGPGASKKLCA